MNMDNGHSSEDIPSSEDGGVGLLRDGGGGNETPTSMSSSPSPIISNGLTGLNRGRSKVWNEFVITGDGTRVTCRRCGDSLSYSHSHSTSSMLKHLKRKHLLSLYPLDEYGNETPTSTKVQAKSPDKPKPKKSKAKKTSFTEARAPEMPSEYQEEHLVEASIQHDPLIFVDPCVRMRWADHSDTFLKTFSVMYNDEVYTDCTLVAENQFFKGHRMVLSSASELLDEMFKITPAVHHPIIFLNNVKAMELRVLLDFIYKGEVAIPPNLIPGLVKVGSELKVKGLSDFVWNEQLASTIFPQGYSNQAPQPQQQQTFHSSYVNDIKLNQCYEKPSCSTDSNCKSMLNTPNQMNIGHRAASNSTINSKPSPPTPVIHKTYARLVPSGIRPGGILSSQQNLSISDGSILSSCTGTPQFKRLKLLETCSSSSVTSVNTSQSNSYVTALESKKSNGNLPDTVLMVTNQGETVLSTSQGGVTLMTPNSLSLPVSFAIKDDSSMRSQTHHSQFVSGQPVTILSSCGHASGHGLDEVVYSITEVPGGGHEVLMSGIEQGPIVVYDDTNIGDDDTTDKKLFQDEMHKG